MTAMREIERKFKAFADRNRLRILKMLEVRPLCVCEITHVMGIAQSSVSRHLSILRNAGFVQDVKNGQWTIYSLSRGMSEAGDTLLATLGRWGNEDPQIADDREKLRAARRGVLCPRR